MYPIYLSKCHMLKTPKIHKGYAKAVYIAIREYPTQGNYKDWELLESCYAHKTKSTHLFVTMEPVCCRGC